MYMVFSSFFRFFTGSEKTQESKNQENQSNRSATLNDLDEIVDTVCNGFNFQKASINSIRSDVDNLNMKIDSKLSQNDIDSIKSEILKNSSDITQISSYLSNLPNTPSFSRDEIKQIVKDELDIMKSHIFDEIKQNTLTSQETINRKPELVHYNVQSEIPIETLTTLEKKLLQAIVQLKVNNNIDEISMTDLSNLLYPGSDPKSKRPTLSAYISKLIASGFLTKTRQGPTVYISLVGDRVINFFLNENYSKLKKVL